MPGTLMHKQSCQERSVAGMGWLCVLVILTMIGQSVQTVRADSTDSPGGAATTYDWREEIFTDGFENAGSECGDLPTMLCEGTEQFCAELLPFEPVQGPGYDNYPINGETIGDQYRSFLRRDLMMLIKHAAAKVACVAREWESGHGAPIGLGDMSEADGSIPGTSTGSPGHPAGTHENGLDIDVAYFQNGTPDNHLRPICDTLDDGTEAYHCTAPPHLLDTDRTALFIGYLAGHPRLRVVGVDGQAGLLIEAVAGELCTKGLLTSSECSALAQKLVYEVTDQGFGWFLFRFQSMHISYAADAP